MIVQSSLWVQWYERSSTMEADRAFNAAGGAERT